MRKSIKEFVKICAETLPLSEPIYEFGALQVPGQEGFADIRPLFPDRQYIGADIREGPGVDVILDLHDIALPAESAQTVLVLDTLEHVEFPRKALEQIHKILKLDGIVIISSVMKFRIHDHPHDYWRFTPQAFKSILKPFEFSFVDSAGDPGFPHTVVGVGCKGSISPDTLSAFGARFAQWKGFWKRPHGSDIKGMIHLFAPLWSLKAYRSMRAIK